MSGEFPEGIVDVQVYRTEFNALKTTMMSSMQSVGATISDDIESAKQASADAYNAIQVASLISPVWKSDASDRATKLMDDLKTRAVAHKGQRQEQYDILDFVSADISNLWNS